MRPKHEFDDVTAKVNIEQLIEKWGTPLIVLDESLLTKYANEVSAQFGDVSLYFPYKSNPLQAVRQKLHTLGYGAEVASRVELDDGLEQGIDPSKILLNQPGGDRATYERAIRERVTIVLDGQDDVAKVLHEAQRAATTVQVMLRVNAGVGAPVWSRFGMSLNHGEIRDVLIDLGSRSEVKVVGVHHHLGTNIDVLEPYQEVARRIFSFWPKLEEWVGYELSIFNMGGGYANTPSRPIHLRKEEWNPVPLRMVIEAVRNEMTAHNLQHIKLQAEPGRCVVESCGQLIASVVRVRDTNIGPSVICDAGVNLLPTSTHIRHEVREVRAQESQIRSDYDLYGPLCMQADIIAVGVPLPSDLKEGDALIIHEAGGYDISFSIPFIQGRCPIVMIGQDGEVKPIRRREDRADIHALEDI